MVPSMLAGVHGGAVGPTRDRRGRYAARGWADACDPSPPPMIDPIVTAGWLARHAADVVVCDVRTAMTGEDPAGWFRHR